jgi:hypothetical protein
LTLASGSLIFVVDTSTTASSTTLEGKEVMSDGEEEGQEESEEEVGAVNSTDRTCKTHQGTPAPASPFFFSSRAG